MSASDDGAQDSNLIVARFKTLSVAIESGTIEAVFDNSDISYTMRLVARCEVCGARLDGTMIGILGHLSKHAEP